MVIKHTLRCLMGLLMISLSSLSGFELPQMLPDGVAPKIVDFTLYRSTDSGEDEYALVWDTKDAKKVTISTLGEVELSGKHVVRESDPSVDEIVLTAFGDEGFEPVKKSVYVKEQQTISITHAPKDDRMDESIPMSPMRQRMMAPGRFRYY